jgi:hypothetical protein
VPAYIVFSFASSLSYYIFESFFENFRKKYSLALLLVEIDTDPDRQALDGDSDSAKLCQSVRIRINTLVKTSLRAFKFFLKSCFNLRVRFSPVVPVPVLIYDSQFIRH